MVTHSGRISSRNCHNYLTTDSTKMHQNALEYYLKKTLGHLCKVVEKVCANFYHFQLHEKHFRLHTFFLKNPEFGAFGRQNINPFLVEFEHGSFYIVVSTFLATDLLKKWRKKSMRSLRYMVLTTWCIYGICHVWVITSWHALPVWVQSYINTWCLISLFEYRCAPLCTLVTYRVNIIHILLALCVFPAEY